jgi:hypothetical protein
MAAHCGVPQGDIELGLLADIDPVASSATRNDDRIAAVLLEDVEHVSGFEHGFLRKA